MKKNKFKKPFLIGITGSFGTGKSLVGSILKSQKIFVIDTDEIVHNILSNKNNVTKKILKVFGKKVQAKNDLINKKILADVVFNNQAKRKKLESIVHPEVRKRLLSLIKLNKHKKFVAVLIPLLFESKLERFYDDIWCVTCKEKTQIDRLERKGFKLSEIKARIKSQLFQDKKAKLSDYVIDNSGTIDHTKRQVTKRLRALAL